MGASGSGGVALTGCLFFAAVLVGGFLVIGLGRSAPVDLRPLDRVPLVVDRVGKRIEGQPALSDVSFRVEAGQVLGLLGPNGSGKTTLLRTIAGLESPDAGEVRVFGHPVGPSSPVLRHVGFAIGRPALIPHLTGMLNLRLAWRETRRPAAESSLGELADGTGLGRDLHRRTARYSEGMRQTLSVAIAMLGRPDLLVLDEPANALDPVRLVELRERLAGYAATGRAVVITTHDLGEAVRLCDEVVVLSGGRVVLSGPPADTGRDSALLELRTDDDPLAANLAAAVSGTGAIEVDSTGVRIECGSATVGQVLHALLRADVAVTSVATRGGLERTYLAAITGGVP